MNQKLLGVIGTASFILLMCCGMENSNILIGTIQAIVGLLVFGGCVTWSDRKDATTEQNR